MNGVGRAIAPTSVGDLLRDLLALTKPRITGLVVATTGTGLWLATHAGGRRLGWASTILLFVATAMVVGAANTLNCFLERDIDALMDRTRDRPLPAGRLDPRLALYFGLAQGALSVPALTLLINPLTGLLAAIALSSYVLVYTPMKQRSSHALLVGAIPGAIPPLLGWTAVTGTLSAPGLVLFGILFLWQIPHFIAISMHRRDDYARAGLKIVPLEMGERSARLQVVLYSIPLVAVTLLLTPLGVAGRWYFVAATMLGSTFLGATLVGLKSSSGPLFFRGLFIGSIVYLTLLFGALIALP